MKILVWMLPFLLVSICPAQIAPVSKLQTAGGFLEVCGPPATTLSAAQVEALKSAPPSGLDPIFKQMDNRMAEVTMCFGYLTGLVEGWKEGHEHGVIAAQFPSGWPKDENKALQTLPLKQLQEVSAAMKSDVPCIPDYVTIGQEQDIVVKFIQKNMLLTLARTTRVVWLAFQETFPCAAQSHAQDK